MENNKQTAKPFVIGLIVVALLAGGLSILAYRSIIKEPIEDSFGYSESNVVDVIGTASAPQDFSDNNPDGNGTRATTTGVIFVGDDVNVLNFDIQFKEASATPAHLFDTPLVAMYQIEKSNDASCSSGDSSINWVDATPNTSTAKTSTTTYEVTPDNNREGFTHQITDWNGLCARFRIGAASSTVWVSASKQSLNAN